MRNEELDSELEKLAEDKREETEYLLKLASVRKITNPSKLDIEKRSKERNITIVEARRELINEVRPLRREIISETGKVLKKRLSKKVRKNLGMKDAGRPKGSKNESRPMSKVDFYKQLKDLVIKNNKAGIETTQRDVAKKLGLGGDRQLRLLLTKYEEKKDWKSLVAYLLTE